MPREFKAPFIYIHTPKTGGTSVHAFLRGFPYLEQTFDGHRGLRWYQQQFGLDIFQQVPVYSVIRNPLDRLVSAYYFARRVIAVPFMQCERFRAISAEYFMTPDDFPKFVSKVVNQGMEDLQYWPFILRPQYAFVRAVDGSVPVTLWPFEQLPNFIRHLSRKYTRSKVDEVPHRNPTPHRHFLKYYTPELIEMVYALYPEDCRIYEQLIRPADIQQATCREYAEKVRG